MIRIMRMITNYANLTNYANNTNITTIRNIHQYSQKFVVLVLLLIGTSAFSQKNLKEGNKEFAEQKFADAEANYRIEKSKSENKSVASYNLGNTIYKQESYEESKYSYLETIEKSQDKSEKHKAYHNLGNALMQEKNYQAAVEAYKNALRNNPYDEQTRYNFALAKEMLDKNPPPPDENQDDKNEDNQDQNQDNQNKENQKGNDNQENQDNQNENQDQNQDKGDNQDNQDQKGDGNQDQKPEGNQGGMPKQRMENLLDAVENQEKGIQQRVQKKKELEQRKGQPRQSEKNW